MITGSLEMIAELFYVRVSYDKYEHTVIQLSDQAKD